MAIKYNPNLKQLSRKLRNQGTLAEVLLWDHLKDKKIRGYRFARQKPVGDYIVDFYCGKLKLVIEVDGGSHNFNHEQHVKRQKDIEDLGLTVLRFRDADVRFNMDGVVRDIDHWIVCNEAEKTQPPAPFSKGE